MEFVNDFCNPDLSGVALCRRSVDEITLLARINHRMMAPSARQTGHSSLTRTKIGRHSCDDGDVSNKHEGSISLESSPSHLESPGSRRRHRETRNLEACGIGTPHQRWLSDDADSSMLGSSSVELWGKDSLVNRNGFSTRGECNSAERQER
jgi:hypothetical protein